MAEPVSIEELKEHLRLDPVETGEDATLIGYAIAARRACELKLNRSIVGGESDLTADDLFLVGQMIRLIVGDWYANRESTVSGTTVGTIPTGVPWLLESLRRIPTP